MRQIIIQILLLFCLRLPSPFFQKSLPCFPVDCFYFVYIALLLRYAFFLLLRLLPRLFVIGCGKVIVGLLSSFLPETPFVVFTTVLGVHVVVIVVRIHTSAKNTYYEDGRKKNRWNESAVGKLLSRRERTGIFGGVMFMRPSWRSSIFSSTAATFTQVCVMRFE